MYVIGVKPESGKCTFIIIIGSKSRVFGWDTNGWDYVLSLDTYNCCCLLASLNTAEVYLGENSEVLV